MTKCVFCEIIAGRLPSYPIAESEQALAFLDNAGDVDGHIVVVPKKHVTNILDCDPATLAAVMTLVQQIANHLVDDCGYEGVNLLNANGVSAGQSVSHFHIHIIPRRTSDGINTWPHFPGAIHSFSEMAAFLKI